MGQNILETWHVIFFHIYGFSNLLTKPHWYHWWLLFYNPFQFVLVFYTNSPRTVVLKLLILYFNLVLWCLHFFHSLTFQILRSFYIKHIYSHNLVKKKKNKCEPGKWGPCTFESCIITVRTEHDEINVYMIWCPKTEWYEENYLLQNSRTVMVWARL